MVNRETGETRRVILQGRHRGASIYYDAEMGVDVADWTPAMIVLDTEAGTHLEVYTGEYETDWTLESISRLTPSER